MIRLKHSSGMIKECPTGFSWTTFFFGCFVPLIRGDIKWAAIIFFIMLLAGVFTVGIGALIAGIIFACFYNKLYIKDQLQKGYCAATEEDYKWLVSHGIVEFTTSHEEKQKTETIESANNLDAKMIKKDS